MHPNIKTYASPPELDIGMGSGSPEGQKAFLDFLKPCRSDFGAGSYNPRR